MRLSASSPELVFNVDKATLKPIADMGQEHATYNSQNQMLTIPSVRSGALAFVDVRLLLTNAATLEFTLTGLVPR